MGDVLLTTPLNAALKQRSPDIEIVWLVRSYTAPLLENNSRIKQIIIDHGGSIWSLSKSIQQHQFDEVYVVLPRFRYCLAVWLARIPKRIGPWSKWYSIFLNVRINQRRSKSKKHEARYNLDLLQNDSS
jgi:ADP-heptose:LPS heptosyltransferase